MNSSEAELENRLEWAREIARRAGKTTLTYFKNPKLAVDLKGDSSPVTVADREAEQLLRALIRERFPTDGIVGEEFGTVVGTSQYTWVLGPIDGTKSFIYGVPLYTTLVAVLTTPDGDPGQGTPEIGVIFAPALDEMVYARRGGPTWYVTGDHPPTQAHVGQVAQLDKGLLLTSEVATFERERQPPALDVYLQLQNQVRYARTWGDAYGYMMVALGRGDVMIDAAMNLWDAAAVQPIIEGAGGVFCDWQGAATVHSGEAIATNRSLAEQVLAYTRGR
jgi:histidinol-phosphatase